MGSTCQKPKMISDPTLNQQDPQNTTSILRARAAGSLQLETLCDLNNHRVIQVTKSVEQVIN